MSDANVIDHLTRPERFGSQTKLAAAAGVKPHTICEKRERNALTHDNMRRILQAAPRMGVQIGPEDFFPELGHQDGAEERPARQTSPAQDAAA